MPRMTKTQAARAMVRWFPVGQRVRVRASGWTGVVVGHVTMANAQGGMVKVELDDRWVTQPFHEKVSKHGPINLERD